MATKKLSNVLITFTVLLVTTSCRKAEQYYEKLDAQPEVKLIYNAVYGVGDTMVFQGRLNPKKNLEINIGGINARILSVERYLNPNTSTIKPDSLDLVKLLITKEMGIGINRLIEVSSGGNTIECPAIEIVEGNSEGYLQGQLQLVKQADISPGAVALYCQNGSGNIYLWKLDNSVTKIAKDGSSNQVLTSSVFKDASGVFTVNSFTAGGVDPAEQNLYFAALTQDGAADNAGNNVYRLCRYNLQTRTLTTLNRTLISKSDQKTLGDYQPFEGNINSAKLFNCTTLAPDSKGNIYINIGNYAAARLSADGTLQYLFKVLNSSSLPKVWDAQNNKYYFISDLNGLFPGVGINGVPKAWDTEAGLMYGIPAGGAINFVQYDLLTRTTAYTLAAKFSPIIYGGATPYISGSFNTLSGLYEVSDAREPGVFGYLPLPGEKVLVLYYQGIESSLTNKYYDQYPALATRNFREKAGRRYAPGKLIRNGYVMGKLDQMLNYDAEGMVYMTANNNTQIVKTKFK